jgi:hypothetical protein
MQGLDGLHKTRRTISAILKIFNGKQRLFIGAKPV